MLHIHASFPNVQKHNTWSKNTRNHGSNRINRTKPYTIHPKLRHRANILPTDQPQDRNATKIDQIARQGIRGLTVTILDEVIEGVAVAIVGKLVAGGGELLEALGGDGGEVAGELGVFRQDHRPSGDETIDQRLLPHLPATRRRNRNPRSAEALREEEREEIEQ